jgi:hypothetical protein
MTLGHEDGNHAGCDPDRCFAAKCAYWRRERGGAPIEFKYGKEAFHGPTVRELAARELQACKDAGIKAVPHESAAPRWV